MESESENGIQAKWEMKRKGVWKGFIRFVDTNEKEDSKEVTTTDAKENTSGYYCSIS
jgi:hypothetical protein